MDDMNLQDVVLDNQNINLSDFGLFLSVLKNKKAYEIILSIILNEDNLKLKEVKVEQVILNKKGKRAIRLDAWAIDYNDRQFDTEMQNEISNDNIPKRSRFYQSLIDSPYLKSGKQTKYKNLSQTVIIFITQDDLFGHDLAMYTFMEKCEEVDGLYLNDGTKKIFLNMSSKNGRPELVSLLQYMKDSRLDNSDVIIEDSRIIQLDNIVQEVRQSEEWEDISMSMYGIMVDKLIEKGLARGIEQGLERGMEQGLERGMEQGLEKGMECAQVEIIKNMYENNFTLEQICLATKLDKETVEQLAKL